MLKTLNYGVLALNELSETKKALELRISGRFCVVVLEGKKKWIGGLMKIGLAAFKRL